MGLACEMRCKNRVLIVRMQGELDHHTAENLREEIIQQKELSNCIHIIMNFQNLSFMDSSGLGVVFGRFKQIRSQGGELVVCSIPPSIHRIFEMSGFYKVVPYVNNEEAALDFLGVTK